MERRKRRARASSSAEMQAEEGRSAKSAPIGAWARALGPNAAVDVHTAPRQVVALEDELHRLEDLARLARSPERLRFERRLQHLGSHAAQDRCVDKTGSHRASADRRAQAPRPTAWYPPRVRPLRRSSSIARAFRGAKRRRYSRSRQVRRLSQSPSPRTLGRIGRARSGLPRSRHSSSPATFAEASRTFGLV